MDSDKSCQKYGHINYKTKLWGIIPHGWKYTLHSQWDTKQLKVCKKPSQYSQGQLEISDHSALAKTAIVERRINMDSEFDNTDSTCLKPDDIEVITSKSISDPTESNEKTVKSTDVDKLMLDKPAVKFLRQYCNQLQNLNPDFLCDRLILVHLAIENGSYAIKARKLKFSSDVNSVPNQLEAIELKFLDLRSSICEVGGHFAEWATKDEDVIASSIKNLNVSEDKSEKSNESSCYAPYHHAFVGGELSKNGINKSKKFTMLMAAQVSGVWNIEENPENYTCSHLAEVKTTNVKTFENQEFYKRVRMQRNWFQAHLAGEMNYLVGINEITSDKRCVKELLLYDVEKIPEAVLNYAEEHKFEPWNSDDAHQRLFLALEFIYGTVKDAASDENFVFIHYDKSDHLYHINDELLLQKYVEERSKVMIYNLPDLPFTISQLKEIAKLVGYTEDEPLPTFVRNGRDIELTFNEPRSTDVFYSKVIEYWKQKINIPVGFERMRIKTKLVSEPQNFKGKFVRIACGSSTSYNNSGSKRR